MMIDSTPDPQMRTVARLAETRRQLVELFFPEPSSQTPPMRGGVFPRSRTLRLLLSKHGFGAISALAGGLLLARPAMLLRLLRWAPVRAIARTLLIRLISTTGSKP
jgi:hypothetical protein